jgi:DNA-binding NarL/FixJ family response regulator
VAGGGPGRFDCPDGIDELTARELEILELIADGLSNEGIAYTLSISRRTVDSHTRAIFLKLGLLNHPLQNQRVRAVTAYWRNRAQAIPQAA